mmetsp:Transcript_31564/g.102862  ORF Transcript_31564/g.102862 Transcript_31564/m.102862 type:complete len:338 (-) Transcript_31564:245-1258(-)
MRILDLFKEILQRRTLIPKEGRVAREENVEDDACAPEVDGAVVRGGVAVSLVELPLHNLRRHVLPGADPRAEPRESDARKAPVRKLDAPDVVRLHEQHILQLDVAVDDVGFVRVVERAQELRKDAAGVLLAVHAALEHRVEQLAALHQLHEHDALLRLFDAAEDLDDIGVVHTAQDFNLLSDLVPQAAAAFARRSTHVEKFSSHQPPTLLLLDDFDHARPPFPDDRPNFKLLQTPNEAGPLQHWTARRLRRAVATQLVQRQGRPAPRVAHRERLVVVRCIVRPLNAALVHGRTPARESRRRVHTNNPPVGRAVRPETTPPMLELSTHCVWWVHQLRQ